MFIPLLQYCFFIQYHERMQAPWPSSLLPVHVPDTRLLLEMCAWKVAAGFPSPAADHTRKRVDLNEHLIRNREATFIFRVKGDSMTGAGIYEGDSLLVDRSVDAKHGHIVLAVLNNEFTVKRLHRRGGTVKLIPENNLYPPLVVKNEDELVIWGVVTYNLHKLC